MAPILEALIERVKIHAQSKIRITAASPLPISNLITLVDTHYKSYQTVQIIRVCKPVLAKIWQFFVCLFSITYHFVIVVA